MPATHAILVATCLLFTGEPSEEKKPIDAEKIVGKWQFSNAEGDDIGSRFVALDAEFGKDGRVTMVAKVKQEDGSLKAVTKRGSYKVTAKKELEMTFDMQTKRSKSWFADGLLVIQDPELDSRVYFDRIKPTE